MVQLKRIKNKKPNSGLSPNFNNKDVFLYFDTISKKSGLWNALSSFFFKSIIFAAWK